MEEKTPSVKKNHTGRDIVTAVVVLAASAAAMFMPLFYFISIVVCCALLCGGRTRFAVLLAAGSFALPVGVDPGAS